MVHHFWWISDTLDLQTFMSADQIGSISSGELCLEQNTETSNVQAVIKECPLVEATPAWLTKVSSFSKQIHRLYLVTK